MRAPCQVSLRTISLVLLVTACQPSAPNTSLAPTAETTPCGPDARVAIDVVDVRSLGRWHAGDKSGNYRVVIRQEGFERIQTMIVVDWISSSLADGTLSVVASRPLNMLEELGPISVGPATSHSLPTGLSIVVPVTNQATGEKGVLETLAGAPGDLNSRYKTSH